MNIKLRKISKDIDNVLNHYERYTKDFNLVSSKCISETRFLENTLKRIKNELSNVLSDFKTKSEEHQIISNVIDTFEAVIQEKQDIYYYSVIDQYGERKYKTDRKGHIIGILEWALDRIAGNIDVGVI
ncbi:pathogenicity island protein [Mammaliicoccus sciuri]|uniref:Pathogenicity island protein n=1 Tax=Mammaliicoccus sciuri TaxID=1296 RepID=A0AAI8GUR5_MAMSC|nr:pathogenicity island protein [Mammaliicoccus sciuri]ASE35353.1 pathogenicity island protein [Mammaliicoccus sciuri]